MSGQRDRHRGSDREQVGGRERGEERTGYPAEEEQRHRRESDRERGEERRSAGLQRRVEDVQYRGLLAPTEPSQAQTPDHALHSGHGVVDHGHKGHREAGDHDRADGHVAQPEHQQRDRERHRHRHGGDDRGPQIVEERAEEQDEEHGADDERQRHVVDRLLKVVGRPIDARVEPDVGHARLELIQCGFDRPGHLEGARAGELLDDQQETGTGGQDGVADQRLMVLDDRCHVAEAKGGTPGLALDRDVREIRGVGDRKEMLDPEALVRRVDEAAGPRSARLEEAQGRYPQRVAGRGDDFLQGDVLVAQATRVDADLELAFALAPDRHVRDAGHSLQPRLDRPPCEDRHVDQRKTLRRHPDHQDPACRRRRLEHRGRLGDVGQRIGFGQSFRDQLPGPKDVRAGLENELDRRQAGSRLGTDLIQPRDPVEQVLLQRHGDQLLDLVRGKAERFRLELDGRRHELGQDVHPRALELDHPQGEDAGCKRQPLKRRNLIPVSIAHRSIAVASSLRGCSAHVQARSTSLKPQWAPWPIHPPSG